MIDPLPEIIFEENKKIDAHTEIGVGILCFLQVINCLIDFLYCFFKPFTCYLLFPQIDSDFPRFFFGGDKRDRTADLLNAILLDTDSMTKHTQPNALRTTDMKQTPLDLQRGLSCICR